MNTATITEKYALCALEEKKNLYNHEIGAYLIASMIVEMMEDGNLEIAEKNKVKLLGREPAQAYSKQLYDIIKEMGKPEIPLKKIIEKLCFGFSHKQLNSIVDLLKEALLEAGFLSAEDKKRFLGSKESLVSDETALNRVIEEIRAALLGDGVLTEDMVLLASLLSSSKFLKSIFTKREKDELKKRLKEIKDTETGKRVKAAQDAIADMHLMMVAVVVAATTV